MAQKEPGHSLSDDESAEVPVDEEAKAVIEDGPEGYSMYVKDKQPEDEEANAPSAESAESWSKIEADEYSEIEFDDGSSEFESNSGFEGNAVFEVNSGFESNSGFENNSGSENSPGSESNSGSESTELITLGASKFGSPFAYSSLRNKHDFFKGLLSVRTQVLFDQIVTEASNLRERLLAPGALTRNGDNGQFCALMSEMRRGKKKSGDDTGLQLFRFKPDQVRLVICEFQGKSTCYVDEVPKDDDSFDSSSSTTGQSPEYPDTISVRRRSEGRPGMDYFVKNKSKNSFIVNGQIIGPYMEIGPLPDFAVIESPETAVFWWRTVAALDYMPVRGSHVSDRCLKHF